MKAVHVGCSGWSYQDWRGVLYPEKLPASKWLERYAEEFSTVEVNNTFYRLATRKAAQGWVERTGPDFIFTLKVSRYLTHVKRLKGIGNGIRRFLAPLKPVIESGRAGPLLWQFPENFRRDGENEDRLAATLQKLPPGRHAFEFRHPSWFEDGIQGLLSQHGVALVIGDDPRRPFQTHEMTTDWTLIRFHRGNRGRGGNYSESELEEWAKRIGRWRRETEVFAYFNNDWQGFAVKNARWLRDRLDRRS